MFYQTRSLRRCRLRPAAATVVQVVVALPELEIEIEAVAVLRSSA